VADRVALCLHGFLRTGASMLPVRVRLRREGWGQVDTPSWRYELSDLDALGERAAARVVEISERSGGGPVDIVTHSMGGLVARAALQHSPPVGRVVMLAPPNRGARMAATLRQMIPVHHLGWDPLAPLQPGAPDALPDGRHVEIGVLTGGRGDRRGYNPLLGEDNDGKVRIDEATLDGAADFLVLPAHHSLVMAWPSVLDHVVRFLREGRFLPEHTGAG
jgi:triacylglycerol lipase